MIGRRKRVLLRHYLERGMSKAEAARELGISRRAVYYWTETGQLHRGADDAPVAYGFRRAGPTGRRPRERGSSRSGICERASSTVARS